ncbi:MAG: PAS domain S-box protein, partial [Bryobacteraceae bacterium]
MRLASAEMLNGTPLNFLHFSLDNMDRHENNPVPSGIPPIGAVDHDTASSAPLFSRAWISRLMDQAGHGVWAIDQYGTTTYVSDTMARILGYIPEEMRGQPMSVFLAEAALPEARANLEAYRAGFSGRHVCRFLNKNGYTIWAQAVAQPVLNTSGECVGIMAVVTDVTDRQRMEQAQIASEERYRDLIENARDAIFTIGLEGTISSWNCAAEQITGYSREDILGKNAAEMSPPGWQTRLLEVIGRTLGGERINLFDLEIRTKTGQELLLEISPRLIFHQGRPTVLQCVARDITERQQKEAAMRRLTRRLLKLRDQERRRLARELHDTTGQTLAALCMNLALVNAGGDPTSGKAFGICRNLADQCVREIRTMSYLLHPPLLDELGLESALGWYVRGFEERSGIKVSLAVGEDLGRLTEDMEITLFR